MKKLFLSLFLIAGVVLVMNGTALSQNKSGAPNGPYLASLVEYVWELTWSRNGQVAVFEVTVAGEGCLSVDVSDFNPSTYPDYWRPAITIMGKPGPWASRLTGTIQSRTGEPGVNGPDMYGPFVALTSFPVDASYTYLVFVSYDRGSDVFGASMRVRFRYSGTVLNILLRPFS